MATAFVSNRIWTLESNIVNAQTTSFNHRANSAFGASKILRNRFYHQSWRRKIGWHALVALNLPKINSEGWNLFHVSRSPQYCHRYMVRDELEHLLDDDDDMAEMYLTDKLLQELEYSCVSSMDEQDRMDEEDRSDLVDRIPAEILVEGNETSVVSDGDLQQIDNCQEPLFGGTNALSRGSHGAPILIRTVL